MAFILLLHETNFHLYFKFLNLLGKKFFFFNSVENNEEENNGGDDGNDKR